MHSLGQLGMVGTTFRRAGHAELSHYTMPADDTAAARLALQGLAAACGLHEVVYLSTCNRVEWIFIAPQGVDIAECRWRIYQYFHGDAQAGDSVARRRAATALHAFAGEGAAEHLFVVAASLDSMVPGEAQILGQVKAALRQATQWQMAGPKLKPIFDEAFAAAKRVRQDTRLGQGAVSMLSLALGAVQERLATACAPRVLAIVGVGDMAHQCGAMWGKQADTILLFVNRTLARAQQLATQYGGRAMGLETFLRQPPPFVVLITATASPTPLFDAAFFAKCGPAPWAVDLAVLRDVVPEALRKAGGTLFDIDRLKYMAHKNRQARQEQLAQARGVIDEMLELFRRRLVAREMAPVTQALRGHFQRTLEADLQTLFERELRAAPVALRNDVRTWAQRLVNRLAHIPTRGLKHVGFVHGNDAVCTFVQAIDDALDT